MANFMLVTASSFLSLQLLSITRCYRISVKHYNVYTTMVIAYIVDKSKRTYEVEIIVTVDIMMLHKLQVFFIDLK